MDAYSSARLDEAIAGVEATLRLVVERGGHKDSYDMIVEANLRYILAKLTGIKEREGSIVVPLFRK